MRDQPLERILRSLPEGEPGPDFFTEVEQRIETRRRRRRRHRVLGSIAAILLLGATIVGVREHRDGTAKARQVEELRAERAQIEAELEDLRTAVHESPPILYLGGTEEVDIVLDLRRLDGASTAPRLGLSRPQPTDPFE